jgi:hypothetical protein
MDPKKRIEELEKQVQPESDLVTLVTLSWDDDRPKRETMTRQEFITRFGFEPGGCFVSWEGCDGPTKKAD